MEEITKFTVGWMIEQFHRISRSQNCVADSMVLWMLDGIHSQVWWEDFPDWICQLVKADFNPIIS